MVNCWATRSAGGNVSGGVPPVELSEPVTVSACARSRVCKNVSTIRPDMDFGIEGWGDGCDGLEAGA